MLTSTEVSLATVVSSMLNNACLNGYIDRKLDKTSGIEGVNRGYCKNVKKEGRLIIPGCGKYEHKFVLSYESHFQV